MDKILNIQALVVLLLVVGAIWAAVSIYKQHGFSWTSIVAPLMIWGIAFLILWVGNAWAIKPMRTQAEGLANQGQDLLNAAIPAIPSAANSTADEVTVSGQSFGGNSSDQGNQSGNQTFSGDGGSNVVIPQPTVAPPQVGDVRWAGSTHPSYGDNFILKQVQCFGGRDTLETMAMQNHIPAGLTFSVVPIKTTWQTIDNEVWHIRVTVPHAQQGAAEWDVNGVVGRAIKKAIGGQTVVGNSNWPLVQQAWDGDSWETLEPVTCNFQ